MQDRRSSNPRHEVDVDLIAVIAAVTDGEPVVLAINHGAALPSGPFEVGHRSLQAGLREWVEQKTGHTLGYIEQLYTFADRDRTGDVHAHRAISISYLGLTRIEPSVDEGKDRNWQNWYGYFPWEDHRAGLPRIMMETIVQELKVWLEEDRSARAERQHRAAVAFGYEGHSWNEELVLERYELLFEARLVAEARRNGGSKLETGPHGQAMISDHRRILATGLARLRTKIKYRPVVFELMPAAFTLLQLQRTVEALAGRLVHKQNFRRLIEQQELVEETDETTRETGGRPAKLFRFRPAVLLERPAGGIRPPILRP